MVETGKLYWWRSEQQVVPMVETTGVVKGDGGGQMKASDWSKNYANQLVTS